MASKSEARFAAYVEDLSTALGHADRTGPLRDYCLGLELCRKLGDDDGWRRRIEAGVEPARTSQRERYAYGRDYQHRPPSSSR